MRDLDLPDPFQAAVIDSAGMDVFGPYPELFWVPHVGPSSFLLARRLVERPGTWEKADLARAVGIGHQEGRTSVLERSLARLVYWRLATDLGGTLHVRRRWPRVTARMLDKVPANLREREPEMAAA